MTAPVAAPAAVAPVTGLAGTLPAAAVEKATRELGVDPDKPFPFSF